MITIKRAYEKPESRDGKRILVDRLWPRGVRKEALALDAWEKELAPSTELRKWFGHDPAKFKEFAKRYKAELKSKKVELQELKKRGRKITLIYAAKDCDCNHALVLKEVLEKI